MAEEFQECEVMFPQEHVQCNEIQSGNDLNSRGFNNKNGSRVARRKKLKKNKNMALAIPVKIPDGKQWCSDVFDYENGGGGEFVPPHLIIRQRLAGEMMEFSVCVGRGRTLKGRDLSQVRNSILRMTGFLES